MTKVDITVDTNKEEFKQQYVSTINSLETIKDYESPTNAQVIYAVKFMAQVLIWILKFMKNYYLN